MVLDCHSPGQAALLFRGVHPRALFVDTVWKLTVHAGGLAGDVTGTDGLDPEKPWEWVASAATEFGHAPGLAEGVDLFRRASSVHLLGGGYVNKVWPYQVSLVSAAAALARAAGVPAYATGLGLIPADLTEDFAAFGQTGVDALAEVVRRTLDAWEVPGSAVTVVEGIPGKDMTVPVKLADRLEGSFATPRWAHSCDIPP